MKTHSSAHPRGFTLIELLVVITIIVILASISMGGYSFITRKQAEAKATIQIGLLSKALEEYKLDNGTYPESNNLELFNKLYGDGAASTPPGKIYLSALDPNDKSQGWVEPDAAGNYSRLVDPWGVEYVYRRGDDTNAKNPDFDLLSNGKDGETNNSNRNAPENRDDIDNF